MVNVDDARLLHAYNYEEVYVVGTSWDSAVIDGLGNQFCILPYLVTDVLKIIAGDWDWIVCADISNTPELLPWMKQSKMGYTFGGEKTGTGNFINTEEGGVMEVWHGH